MHDDTWIQVCVISENQWGDTSKQSAKIFMYFLDDPSTLVRFHLDKFTEIDFVEGLAFVPDSRYYSVITSEKNRKCVPFHTLSLYC